MRLLATRLTAIASAVKRLFSPASLFRNAEQGVWYDPSDFSTLFQDSAGTTPVTAVGQPVGLILDKSKGLVLGAELVTNGGFDTNITGWSQTTGAIQWDNGTLLAGTGATGRATQTLTLVSGRTYLISVSKTAGALADAIIRFGTDATGATGSVLAITNLGIGTYTYRVPATAATMYISVGSLTSSNFDNISVKELPGNHATQATAASRPILKQDANGKYYLLFDGVDDSLSTASIDFTSTDKMTVFAGVRKLSDAATGSIVETFNPLATIGNTFSITGPQTAAANFAVGMIESGAVYGVGLATTFASPVTKIVTGIFDRSATGNAGKVKARINSIVQTLDFTGSAGTLTTGNFTARPLYVGRRGGAERAFNGHLYSLIVRGAQSSDSQIVSAESYVNSKTGAY